MDIAPFNAPASAKGRAKVIKIRDGTEVAERYFVYKLYEATGGQARLSDLQLEEIGSDALGSPARSRGVHRGLIPLRCLVRPNEPMLILLGTRPRFARCNAIGYRRPEWLVQDCCGCWEFPFPFPFPFSCSCGRAVGCIRLG